MGETQLRQENFRVGSKPGRANVRDSGSRVQLKHQLAGLTYDEQMAAVRPPAFMAPAHEAVQLKSDPVQMGKGKGSGGSKVPQLLREVRDWMHKKFKVLKKYLKYNKTEDKDLAPYVEKLKAFKSKKPTAGNKAAVKKIFLEAYKISAEKDPTQTNELRGVYGKMNHVVVPQWQADLEKDGASKKKRAQLAVSHRNWFKTVVRESQTELNLKRAMELRNMALYKGSPIGPKYKDMYAAYIAAGLSEDEAHDKIIGKAQTSNKDVDKSSGDGKK